MNSLLKDYFSKTINYKLLLNYKKFFNNEDLLTINYFYWFYRTEYKHEINGFFYKKKNSFSVNTFFLLSYFKTIKVYQIFFINSPFLFFIKKIRKNFKALKKIFFFRGKKNK